MSDSRVRVQFAAANATAIKAIPPHSRGGDAIVKDLVTGLIWQFDTDSEADASDSVLVPDAGAGRWLALDTIAGATALAAIPTKRTVTVGHADLTAASNGLAQAINIGATLPANARIISVDASALTPFSGGSASAVGMTIGTSGDVDALISVCDVFAAAVDGGPSSFTAGIRPNKLFATVGAQLIATFTPDGSHTLLGLTAGSITIDVFYTVLA